METFQELREKAKRKIQIADHMTTTTYKLVGDPRMLISGLENVFLAMTYTIGCILHYERTFKRIPAFQDNFDSKFNMFNRVSEKYKLDHKFMRMIMDIKETILQHRQSPIEFTRADKFVICDSDYKMKTVSAQDMRNYITAAKELYEIAEKITGKDEAIFK